MPSSFENFQQTLPLVALSRTWATSDPFGAPLVTSFFPSRITRNATLAGDVPADAVPAARAAIIQKATSERLILGGYHCPADGR
jgi:hypothetical protein